MTNQQFIIEQDRESIYELTKEFIRYYKHEMGWNLVMKHDVEEVLLGTFDTEEEVEIEYARILESDDETISVSGHVPETIRQQNDITAFTFFS